MPYRAESAGPEFYPVPRLTYSLSPKHGICKIQLTDPFCAAALATMIGLDRDTETGYYERTAIYK